MDQKQNENKEKVLTKYDRKVLEHQRAAAREKKRQFLTIIISAVVIAALIALAIILPFVKKQKAKNEYIKINDSKVSLLEFNFYRSTVINNYSQFFPYFGVDTSKSLAEQIYDESTGETWADFFDEQAASTVKEARALKDDIEKKNLSFDVSEEYKTTIDSMKKAAEEAKISYKEYLINVYGSYATEKALKPYITDQLTASAYYKNLQETLAVADDVVQKEYDDNKVKYDSFDYRTLLIKADIPEGATEEVKTAAIADAKLRAQEMEQKVKDGKDFETLCAEYAAEADKEAYADTETDKSLVTGATQSSSYVLYSDWLFNDERKEGDTYVYENATDGLFYVVKFEKRYLADTAMASIKESLTYNVVSDYISELLKGYTINDPKGNLPNFSTASDDTSTEGTGSDVTSSSDEENSSEQ